RLVLAPVGVDLPGDLWGQLVGNALHGTPRRRSDNPCRHCKAKLARRPHGTPAFFAASGSIFFSASPALERTPASLSLRASIRAGTAAFASTPIRPSAEAARLRTPENSSLRASLR